LIYLYIIILNIIFKKVKNIITIFIITMCGIFALLNYNVSLDIDTINNEFLKGKRRGPEFSKLDTSSNENAVFGFHRLAINGLNSESNQPFFINDILLICNGEIYNCKQLYASIDVTPKTSSDCEVIIYLYERYGIEQTLIMLDGVFGFVLYDTKLNKLYVARDPMGVRPLYSLTYDTQKNYLFNLIGFASELKCLSYFQNLKQNMCCKISHIKPGTYSIYAYGNNLWQPEMQNVPYYLPSFPHTILGRDNSATIPYCQKKIAHLLHNAVIKRCETTERPVACLLSGGLDSSLIAALVADYFRKQGRLIETYSIGLAESEDIKYARIVADYIGSNHREIIVTEDDMFNAIPEVIEALESYDTTTVRASLGNYLIGKHIAANSEAKVIFNGDGSDELFGGYLYMNKCPDDIEFDKENRRLLKDIHLFDVLRSDKSISSNGLEPRTPFLDKTFVNYILSIPAYFRNHNNFNGEPEKYLLRGAFNSYFLDSLSRKILPDEILWRRKEAFSDGVSSQSRSLFVILQEKIRDHLNIEVDKLNAKYIEYDKHYWPCEANIETEKTYYKRIFDKLYPNCSHIVPYFWMPKYTNATDPSARTLEIYK
jgi:asparagine synthase (glutamine-hydrolysing)